MRCWNSVQSLKDRDIAEYKKTEQVSGNNCCKIRFSPSENGFYRQRLSRLCFEMKALFIDIDIAVQGVFGDAEEAGYLVSGFCNKKGSGVI